MTWNGGKLTATPVVPHVTFARLRPLDSSQQSDHAASFKRLSHALRDFGSQVRLHIRLVSGDDGEKVAHWEVEGGTAKATARRGRPKNADVHIVMRPETWAKIASGQLAPYDALLGGKLRVGGNLDTAKSITKHLSDPSMPYVAPC
ncbi:MAG: SCP2 sterol-binding domain-containing protein [Candidatus Korobacteraceae bacterium]